ncbi:hypothetical protein BDZ97DRAFT_1914917 [Flammula alnicola]|nr:hypothetical protein BDZ97DRAFT_1914917 [Flammula alnicola]
MDAGLAAELKSVHFKELLRAVLSSLQLVSLFTWGLHGILCVQVYNYYLSFPRDPTSRKLLVYGALALETIQLVLVTRDTYQLFALGFGNPFVINKLHLLPLTIPIMGGLVGLLCHLIFAYRIYRVSESKIIGCLITALAICASSCAFVFGAKLFEAGSLSNAAFTSGFTLPALWNGFGAACDVVIAACMTYYLSRMSTGFRKTDLLVTQIIRLSIETGIITVVLRPAGRIITKMYSITILATFNNRPHAVGGPPPLADAENCYDSGNKAPSGSFDGIAEIRIQRTVVEQVWDDDIALSRIQMYNKDDEMSIKNDRDSSKNTPESLTQDVGVPIAF